MRDLLAFMDGPVPVESGPALIDGEWRITLGGQTFRFEAESPRGPEFRRPPVWRGWQEPPHGSPLRAVEFYCTAGF